MHPCYTIRCNSQLVDERIVDVQCSIESDYGSEESVCTKDASSERCYCSRSILVYFAGEPKRAVCLNGIAS